MKLINLTECIGAKTCDKTAVRVIKNAGFDGVDYSMFGMKNDESPLCKDNYREYVKELRLYADSLGISFVQGHAPFPSFDSKNMAYTDRIKPYITRSIEIAGMLGVKHLIIHPVSPTQIPKDAELKEFNMSFYRSLLPYAKEYGVTVCLENMWGYDSRRGYIIPNVCSFGKDLAEYVDALDSPYFAACLDVGHCGLVGEDTADAIRALGKDRLKALHVHDNDFRHDSHILPFHGSMNWDSVISALAEIGYEGNLTFEADSFLTGLPANESLYLSAEKYMHDVGRYLISLFESRK